MKPLRTYLLIYVALLVGTAVILGIVGLVFHYRESASSAQTTNLRQQLLADMTAHCLKGARSIHDNQPDQKNVDYCNCAMSRTFAEISDTELVASNSSDLVRTAIKKKMDEAGRSCRAEVFPGK